MEQSEKFHRPKAPPSFEYFSESAIKKGNVEIQQAHALLQQYNLPLFKLEEYLKTLK